MNCSKFKILAGFLVFLFSTVSSKNFHRCMVSSEPAEAGINVQKLNNFALEKFCTIFFRRYFYLKFDYLGSIQGTKLSCSAPQNDPQHGED